MINRIKRLEGQLRGILNMMDEEKECKDVVTQLSAVRSAIDKSIGLIVSKNLVTRMIEEEDSEESKQKLIQEAVNLLVKSR
ncbi:metal-sensitive transcriptional regulator [uncultured Clostridium sp.]|uniref:metal-sensitive transcriptional regulator n=1 Tax=uncultured Clostridium sp. TaxID=59620 RepID=UPI00342AF9F1